jgi:hypothetical protein
LKLFLRQLSSPAVLISLAALVLASSGFAIAASTSATSPTIKACYKKKKGTLRILRSGKCKKSETAISWNKQGIQGVAGTPGAQGGTGATGTAGSARAYAHVNSSGTVDDTQSKNVSSSNVSRPTTGAYCFHDLGFTPQNAVASIDAGTFSPGSSNPIAYVSLPGGGGFCPGSTTQVGVFLWNATSTANHGFYVSIN